MTLHIIAIAFERPLSLRILIDSLLVQTCQAWSLTVIHDGEPPESIKTLFESYKQPLYAQFLPQLNFTWSPSRVGNWGHANRNTGIQNLKATSNDFVLLTNDDNYYVPTFVGQMLNAANDRIVDIVMCDTIHNHLGHSLHTSNLAEGGIDMGAFIVRYPIAKIVGFVHTHLTADGRYATECKAFSDNHNRLHRNGKVIHINRPLFIHN